MFYWRDKRSQKDQADKLETVFCSKDGLSRRAFGLFPQPKDQKPVRIDLSSHVNYQKFLVDLEGQEETTCVRLISAGRKTRAAMLILRGRVLGCIYGRAGEEQLLGQEAYTRMTAEMLLDDIVVDAYKIDDKSAIASSAMFHGELFSAPSTMTSAEVFHFSLEHLLDTKMPGTILINENDGTRAILYTFKGKIHGLYSFQDGWLEPTIESAENVLKNTANYSVQSSKLLCANVFELKEFTFSMTGLGEANKEVKQYKPLNLDYGELTNPDKKNKDSLAKALTEGKEHRDQSKPSGKPWKLGMDP